MSETNEFEFGDAIKRAMTGVFSLAVSSCMTLWLLARDPYAVVRPSPFESQKKLPSTAFAALSAFASLVALRRLGSPSYDGVSLLRIVESFGSISTILTCVLPICFVLALSGEIMRRCVVANDRATASVLCDGIYYAAGLSFFLVLICQMAIANIDGAHADGYQFWIAALSLATFSGTMYRIVRRRGCHIGVQVYIVLVSILAGAFSLSVPTLTQFGWYSLNEMEFRDISKQETDKSVSVVAAEYRPNEPSATVVLAINNDLKRPVFILLNSGEGNAVDFDAQRLEKVRLEFVGGGGKPAYVEIPPGEQKLVTFKFNVPQGKWTGGSVVSHCHFVLLWTKGQKLDQGEDKGLFEMTIDRNILFTTVE
jgi:hypothetical protein